MRPMLAALLVLALVALPGPLFAEDAPTKADALLKPSQAWQQINAASRKAPYAKRADLTKAASLAYLERLSAQGGMALGSEALSLGFIQRGAQQWDQAAVTFHAVWANAEHADGLRDQGAMHEAALLANKDLRAKRGVEGCLQSLEGLRAYAAAIDSEKRSSMRSSIENNIANALDGAKQKDAARDLRIAVVKRDPMMVARLYRSLLGGLLGSTHALDGYAKVQSESQGLIELLAAQQAKAVESLEAKQKDAPK